MEIAEGETALQFAERVQRVVAEASGIEASTL